MAEANRAELLSTVTENDVESLCVVTEKLFTDKTLEDTVVAFNKRQKTELWDDVLGMCMKTLLDSNNDEVEGSQTLAKMHRVLLCIARLASATLSSLGQLQNDEEEDLSRSKSEVEVPPSLHETAVILHGILPTLKSERNGIKNTVCNLFETWWALGILGKEELMANTFLCLLDRSTQLDATKTDVVRVMAIHQVLLAADLCKDSAGPLVNLLLQCSYHPQYMTSPQGTQFLAFLFTLNQDFAQRLHDTIKVHLPSVPVSWGSKYGEIYFRAWQKSSDEQREFLELHCIQDIMHNACRMRMGARGSLWYALFKILSSLHAKKTQRGVLDMLTRLYGPILWRSLMVCNSDVRLSAAHIMFDAFPLQDLGLDCQETDKALQKQLDAMHSLLQDPVPAVRLAAVTGVGRVLSIYWELIPPDVIKCFMTTLVEDLVYDITSPLVREAVIKVMQELCSNHLALTFLPQVLPTLGNFVHDTSERVRVAMLELLLRLKGVRSVKFYHVVPVEHLLARLEVDTSEPVVRRVMKLLYRSFVPTQETPQQQLERCKALILTNQGAARQFYLHLPKFLDTEDSVKYLVVLCRYLVESARQLHSNHEDISGDQDNKDEEVGLEKDAGDGSENLDSPQTPRRSRRASAKRSKMSKDKQSGSTKDDEDDNEGETENTDLSETQHHQQQLVEVLRGVTEAIYLMYITLSPVLDADEEFHPMREGLAKKLSVTVREMMAVSQDPELYNTLIALAGHLPSRAIPMASQSLMKRLIKHNPGKPDRNVDITCSVKALVQWGKANTLIEMVKESIDKALSIGNEEDVGDVEGEAETGKTLKYKNDKKREPKKKTVGFSAAVEDVLSHEVALQVMEVMLAQPECRPILMLRHSKSLISLAKSLGVVTNKLKHFVSPTATEHTHLNAFSLPESHPASVPMYIKMYSFHLRLCAFLSCRSEKNAADLEQNVENDHDRGNRNNVVSSDQEDGVREEADRALVTALTWSSACLLPWLKSTTKSLENHSTTAQASSEKGNSASKGKKGKGPSLVVETLAEKQRQVLLQMLIFNLKITSSVMIASCVGSAFLDEAVQLCLAVLHCLNSTDAAVVNSSLLVSTLGCVYHFLSLRVKEADEKGCVPQPLPSESTASTNRQEVPRQTTSQVERCTDVACSCLCLLLKALTAPTKNTQGTSETVANLNGVSDVAKITFIQSDRAELLNSITPSLTELIVELTRPGQPAWISQKTASAALRCALEDVERACERENDGSDLEEMKLPALALTILNAVKRKTVTLKLFCAEVESCLSGDEIFNIYQARALLSIVSSLYSCDPTLQSPVLFQALRASVLKASGPSDMDEDVFNDLHLKTEKALNKLQSELLSDI